MRDLKYWVMRQMIFCLAASLVVPFGAAQTNPSRIVPNAAADHAVQASSGGEQTATTGTNAGAAQPTVPSMSSGTTQAPAAPEAHQYNSPQAAQNTQDSQTTAPVGTAAAPYQKQEGISASKPGGAAIAPGKQRRIRSFAIRVGLLVGAGIAIGVVTAATLGSPNRP